MSLGVTFLTPELSDYDRFKLFRLVEWAGYKREDFTYQVATSEGQVDSPVLVPLGNGPSTQVLGPGAGILTRRGYVERRDGRYIIPTVDPAFIRRGQSKWSAPFINDVQKAANIALFGVPPQFLNYILDPSPLEALNWARRYQEILYGDERVKLAFDIETPGKGEDEDDLSTDSDAPDRTWNIERIGFSYSGLSAISFPWAPEYRAAVSLLLGSSGDKVVWNAGFDVPRLRRAGCDVRGTIHDGMVAWHILHSDLPKRLGFVATFTCPWQPAWKHLSGARPAFYNATDADVELRSMWKIEEELRKSSLWDVYQRDVLDLEPILVHMHEKGMPVDADVRSDRAIKLDRELREVRAAMEQSVPIEARRIDHVYRKPPANLNGLSVRPGTRLVNRCSQCGAKSPSKPHFKRFVKKKNPCADGEIVSREEAVDEYYRLADFSPSRDQLIRYHQLLKRPLPTIFDKKSRMRKVSFGERQLKDLVAKHPGDVLYSLILRYRELDKIAGTYIGRPVNGT